MTLDPVLKINAVGTRSNTGFGVAYDRHVSVLKQLANVQESQDRACEVGYYHGPLHGVKELKHYDRKIIYAVCETTALDVDARRKLSMVDELWTCSNFCFNVLSQYHSNVKLVPHYSNRFGMSLSLNQDKPAVLIAFNTNSRFSRKNPIEAIRVVKSSGLDVKLYIKAGNLTSAYRGWLKEEAKGLDSVLVDNELTTDELNALYDKVDVILSLHRSEGFGLHLLEGMALGKLVVATAFGGNVDFMQEGAFLVDAKEVKATDDYFVGNWGKPDFDHAVVQLKVAVEQCRNPQYRRAANMQASKFSTSNTFKATQAAL